MDRRSVHEPFATGVTAVDAMIPIGRGQRELIIGDRQTGKTTVAVDAILNQTDVLCVYVAVGQKTSTVAEMISGLARTKDMSSVVVLAVPMKLPRSSSSPLTPVLPSLSTSCTKAQPPAPCTMISPSTRSATGRCASCSEGHQRGKHTHRGRLLPPCKAARARC